MVSLVCFWNLDDPGQVDGSISLVVVHTFPVTIPTLFQRRSAQCVLRPLPLALWHLGHAAQPSLHAHDAGEVRQIVRRPPRSSALQLGPSVIGSVQNPPGERKVLEIRLYSRSPEVRIPWAVPEFDLPPKKKHMVMFFGSAVATVATVTIAATVTPCASSPWDPKQRCS